ncbi:hypothetical protein [Antarcticirhabdus aurantiaca]|uniref:hypothetical protein n=1 Tax=Antarcticirhabdus aurantiaca TaxID=2606717 RepID=UPI00131C1E73|nr:hypothetical protein [Antarcticirhabdus aurantiaca]
MHETLKADLWAARACRQAQLLTRMRSLSEEKRIVIDYLTDDDWRRCQFMAGGLPDERRLLFELLITDMRWELRDAQYSSSNGHARKALARICKLRRGRREKLLKSARKDFTILGALGPEIERILSDDVPDNDLLELIMASIRRLPREKPGPKNDLERCFLARLKRVLAICDKRLTASKREVHAPGQDWIAFLATLMKASGFTIGNNQDAATKALNLLVGRTGRENAHRKVPGILH